MYFPVAIGFGSQRQILLNSIEGFPVNNCLMGSFYPIPLVFRHIDQNFGFIADLLPPSLDHDTSIHLVMEDAPDRGFVPKAKVVFRGVVAGPAFFRFVTGRIRNACIIEHSRNILLSTAFQGPLKNLTDYLGCLRINDDVVLVSGVFFVAIDGEPANVLSLPALQVKDHTDVFGEILQVPLIDQPVDLAGFLVAFDLGIGIVSYRDEADAPYGEQSVDVLLHQFHISGETGLGFAEDDLELLCLRCNQHPVEVRTEAVGAGVVFIAVDGVDVPSMVDGVVG